MSSKNDKRVGAVNQKDVKSTESNKEDTKEESSTESVTNQKKEILPETRVFFYMLLLLLVPSVFVLPFHDKKFIMTLILSLLSFFLSKFLVNRCSAKHIEKGLYGKDINKLSSESVPETMGLEAMSSFILFLIISTSFSDSKVYLHSAVISILSTLLLGFADDVFDIKWRYKIVIPLITVLPVILDYNGSTTICFHGFLAPIKQFVHCECLDVGFLYILFIINLFVFCTHSINIYAGINGLEAGQSFIVACGLLFHSLYYWDTNPQAKASATILLPFIFSTYGLLYYNWYPSKVFVGDTYTLTAGATIGVAGILGHFSEMTLMFMLPQLINFVISLPQLLGIVPCPRHRLATVNKTKGLLEGKRSNLNVLNWWLIIFGPKTEARLCVELLIFQVLCCILAYITKYLYNTKFSP